MCVFLNKVTTIQDVTEFFRKVPETRVRPRVF